MIFPYILELVLVLPAFANHHSAKIFKRGSDRKEVLFTYQYSEKKEGSKQIQSSQYFLPNGTLAGVQTLEIDSKGTWTLYQEEQLTAEEKGLVTRKDEQIFYQYTRPRGTDKDDEKWVNNFVLPPQVADFIQKHWKELMEGREVKFRLALPMRQESIGFKLSKEKEIQMGDRKAIEIKMAASSFFISMLTHPQIFRMSPDGMRVYEIDGRVFPLYKHEQGKHAGKFKPLDAEMVFDKGEK